MDCAAKGSEDNPLKRIASFDGIQEEDLKEDLESIKEALESIKGELENIREVLEKIKRGDCT